jgi:hypothetical protein
MVFIGAGRTLWYFGFVFHFILIYEVVKSLFLLQISSGLNNIIYQSS